MNNKSKQDIEDILNSARAAMEAVGLPMEKFIPFQAPPLLFSNPLNRKPSDLARSSETSFQAKKEKCFGKIIK